MGMLRELSDVIVKVDLMLKQLRIAEEMVPLCRNDEDFQYIELVILDSKRRVNEIIALDHVELMGRIRTLSEQINHVEMLLNERKVIA